MSIARPSVKFYASMNKRINKRKTFFFLSPQLTTPTLTVQLRYFSVYYNTTLI